MAELNLLGLLAGLLEPPTTPVPVNSTGPEHFAAASDHLATLLARPVFAVTERQMGSVPHIFSHINMTYHVRHLYLVEPEGAPPALKRGTATMQWLDDEGVLAANVGTGVKKCWAAVYGTWGKFDDEGVKVNVATIVGNGKGKATKSKAEPKPKTTVKAAPVAKRRKKAEAEPAGGKVKGARKVSMPVMPKREVK